MLILLIILLIEQINLKIIKSMNAQGNLQISQPKNAKAFKNKKVVFFLTKLGFIIELIEE